jgi:uncharacterized membrane protein
MKKFFIRILAGIVIIVLVFSPYLLVIDYKRYSPVVLIIWILSIAYYLLLKRRVDRLIYPPPPEDEKEPDKE